MFYGATHRDVGSRLKDPPQPPLKGGDVLGGRGFVLDVSIGDWKETIHQNALAF